MSVDHVLKQESFSRGQPALLSGRQNVPRFLERLLYVLLGVMALVSVVTLTGRPQMYPTIVLDMWLILLWVFLFFRGRTEYWALMWVFTATLAGVIALAVVGGSPMYDTLQAYRWVVYLIVLATAVGRTWSRPRGLVVFSWLLISLALIRYTLLVLLGLSSRPTLLLENNFELALFTGLTAVTYKHMTPRQRILMVLAVGLLVALSGSRSGGVLFVLLVIYAISASDTSSLFSRYLLLWTIPIAGLVALDIFQDRTSSVESIDRVRFFNVFLDDVSHWHLGNWLFGTMPISPMSSGACQRLSYYEGLFSSTGDGSCYSVILHAFLLRVVFDAGILGLAVSVLAPIFLMRRAGVQWSLVLTLTGVAIANGLSVSGANNPYVFLPMLLAVFLARLPSTPMPAPQTRLSLPSSSRRRY